MSSRTGGSEGGNSRQLGAGDRVIRYRDGSQERGTEKSGLQCVYSERSGNQALRIRSKRKNILDRGTSKNHSLNMLCLPQFFLLKIA